MTYYSEDKRGSATFRIGTTAVRMSRRDRDTILIEACLHEDHLVLTFYSNHPVSTLPKGARRWQKAYNTDESWVASLTVPADDLMETLRVLRDHSGDGGRHEDHLIVFEGLPGCDLLEQGCGSLGSRSEPKVPFAITQKERQPRSRREPQRTYHEILLSRTL